MRQQTDDAQRQLKSEQNQLSELRYTLVAKDDQINRMSQDMDQLVQQFIQKKDQYKTQLKTQKQKMIDQVTQMDQQNRTEIESLTKAKQELERGLQECSKQLQ